uniref:Cysteine-rich PDZ-binding protein n=1 Tax=Solanum tuberosum TaxID=4113 RepID=M0ZPQ4_SOLTU
MVCDKCEKKLSKVIVPDKWKEGASNTTEGGGRGHLMEIQSALFASNKCIKMANIAIPVLIVKEYVQCVESKFLTPSYTNRAMYDVDMVDELTSMLPQHTLILENCSYFVNAMRTI